MPNGLIYMLGSDKQSTALYDPQINMTVEGKKIHLVMFCPLRFTLCQYLVILCFVFVLGIVYIIYTIIYLIKGQTTQTLIITEGFCSDNVKIP